MLLHGILNHFMLGTSHLIESSMLDRDNNNFLEKNKDISSLFVTKDQLQTAIDESRVVVAGDDLDGILFKKWKIPNILYSPENIFGNKIPALDVNFINPHKYAGVEYSEGGNETFSSSQKTRETPAEKIAPTIADWYKGFRNVAVVGLLSVLVYIGIRILIGSTAPEKAKYKERLMDWLVALCLVFVMHIIMSGVLMLTEKITDLFSQESSDVIVAVVEDPSKPINVDDVEQITDSYGFRTNLTGYVRFMAQSSELGDSAAYTVIYIAFIIYTVMFTFIYFKRFLYMAFFTMIAPLVALTYPLDKMRDGKAQAFNLWFKEYTMNAILQPVHLILYTVLVSSAMELAIENPIYAIFAIAFLLPAEKFIKKMFGLDRAESTSALGAFAGGALTMKGIGAVAGMFKGNGKKASEDKGVLDKASTGLKTVGAVTANPLATIAGGALGLVDKGKDAVVAGAKGVAKGAAGVATAGISSVVNDDGIGVSYDDLNVVKKEENPKLKSAKFNQSETTSASETDSNKKIKEQTKNEKRGGLKNAFSAVGYTTKQRLKNTFSKESMRKGVKYFAKSSAKLTGAALGATALGTIGAAAGITMGDLEKGLSMTAGAAATGAGLGGILGGKTANAIEDKISNSSTMSVFKNAYDPSRPDRIKNKEIESFQREFKNSVANYQTLINKGFSAKEAKEFLEKEVQDYLNVGIDNINLMIKAEKKYKDKYDKAGRVARAQLASNLPKNYSKDLEAQKKFMDSVKTTEPRLTANNVRELNNDMLDLLD